MAPARKSYRLARASVIVLAALLSLAVAFLAGRGTAGGASSRAAQSPQAAGTDHSHTAEGAITAYLDQQAQLADPALWLAPPGRRAKELDGILASSELRQSVERSIDAAAARADPLGRALQSHDVVLARSAALGYRLISYSRRRAIVDAWTFSLLGGEGVPLDLRLAHYRAIERWVGGAWRLVRTRAVGEGSAVRFRGAPELSARLAASMARFERVRSEP